VVPVADSTGWYTHWIAIERDVTERRRMQERVAFLAYHDDLTRLLNRAGLRHHLECRRGSATADDAFTLLQIDLDRFKAVNDRYGHAVGDRVLVEVARRLERCVGDGDAIARTGGDEFVVVRHGVVSRRGAEAAAWRVRCALAPPLFWNGQAVAMGASVGASLYPRDGANEQELLGAADLALYRAKLPDAGGVALFDQELRARVQAANRLEQEIRAGLEAHAFTVHFQPQWRLSDDAIVGVECLLRWQHPERGLLAPGAFMEVVAERGLMRAVQVEMLELVVAAARRQRQAGRCTGPFAINLTACELADEGFARRFLDRLTAAGLEPHDLAVEVVEGVFLDDARATIVDNLHILHERGVAIELDDFGTGFASLTHLRSFPIDRVKIDYGFVADLMADPQDATIVRAIVELAHNLGMAVVAEGVETEAQRARLERFGCDAAQGHLRAAPMPEADFAAWLEDAPPALTG